MVLGQLVVLLILEILDYHQELLDHDHLVLLYHQDLFHLFEYFVFLDLLLKVLNLDHQNHVQILLIHTNNFFSRSFEQLFRLPVGFHNKISLKINKKYGFVTIFKEPTIKKFRFDNTCLRSLLLGNLLPKFFTGSSQFPCTFFNKLFQLPMKPTSVIAMIVQRC